LKTKDMIVALAGGVGGARLAYGLSKIKGEALAVIVNTGDDFEHLGLSICPDIDTMLYTLAGWANPETGWGVDGDSWSFMDQLGKLGGPIWFKLGDRDLAIHVQRSHWLRQGDRLGKITSRLAQAMGIASTVLPMSEDAVRTKLETDQGDLDFQDYFVRLQAKPLVRAIRFEGASSARPTPAAMEAFDAAKAIIICPSNPYLSIDPILSVPGYRECLQRRKIPCIAVSPIIGGAAVKGPAAKLMQELGAEVSCVGVAKKYAGLIDGLVIDGVDEGLADAILACGIKPLATKSLMRSLQDRIDLAQQTLDFALSLQR
jgi:LPPG:FO 2-phospho-L-lactate transferase